MLTLQLSEFSLDRFLAEYWQQKPVLIRQGFPAFRDLISPDELAGLACEPQIDSRLISRRNGEWQAERGPFQDYSHLGERDWTLVVQAVDHWSPDVAELVQAFAFIPKWRLDDVMISFAAPGGGVGPHIDLYDVFICQGSGKRHWRVGDRGAHRQFAAHPALLHTDPFAPIIDAVVEAGDILYIPPGFPHEGVSLDSSMSFSVGFRSRSASDMLSGLADYLIDHELGKGLISDPRREAHQQQGYINRSDFAMIRAQMQSVLNDDALMADVVGSLLSTTRSELDLQAMEPPLEADELLAALEEQQLRRTGGLRCFYLEPQISEGICYVDGERHTFGAALSEAVRVLCNHDVIGLANLGSALQQTQFLTTLLQWVNQGYWYLDEPD
ncbi:MAG: JmjC domain-containing protein [Undibacterium curvum]|uniref:ribosomal protein uL16 3-hydroxylase n=1 Tax=Undibacterium curvum TaxID=2762294 RepID=UPI003BC53162